MEEKEVSAKKASVRARLAILTKDQDEDAVSGRARTRAIGGGGGNLMKQAESAIVCRMTAVAEIEARIERLSPAEVKELAAWLEEYQQMINASADIFSMYEREQGGH